MSPETITWCCGLVTGVGLTLAAMAAFDAFGVERERQITEWAYQMPDGTLGKALGGMDFCSGGKFIALKTMRVRNNAYDHDPVIFGDFIYSSGTPVLGEDNLGRCSGLKFVRGK